MCIKFFYCKTDGSATCMQSQHMLRKGESRKRIFKSIAKATAARKKIMTPGSGGDVSTAQHEEQRNN